MLFQGPKALVGAVLCLVFVLCCAPNSGAGLLRSAQAQELKKTGFYGDPSQKRGMEYGYDRGLKAAKADRAAGLSPDPSRHGDYEDPNQFYRYEFGSRSRFVAGFRGGFLGGYQAVLGKSAKPSRIPPSLSNSSPLITQASVGMPPAVQSQPRRTKKSASAKPIQTEAQPTVVSSTANDAF